MQAAYNGQSKTLNLLVVKGHGPSLMGKDWLSAITLDWPKLFHLQRSTTQHYRQIIERHPNVFKDDMGRIESASAKLQVRSDAKPAFYIARSVPYALHSKVEEEDRSTGEGWHNYVCRVLRLGCPIVPVVKRDGSIRICGDYKLTINKVAETDTYPLPRIKDLFTSLSGGRSFSKLDLAHDDSKKYTTVNTHKGLYRYNRLPLEVSSAPSIFQRMIATLLQGLPHVCVYLDDILDTGTTEEEHLRNLEQVLPRLDKANIRLKHRKCKFLLPPVEYLGHRISAQGLQPTTEKVNAIQNAPHPRNVPQLKISPF